VGETIQQVLVNLLTNDSVVERLEERNSRLQEIILLHISILLVRVDGLGSQLTQRSQLNASSMFNRHL